jgi:hypothetical protein
MTGTKEVWISANPWMQQMTFPVLASMFCPATLEKLVTLFGMMMCALQAFDTCWAPVFEEQVAGGSVVV